MRVELLLTVEQAAIVAPLMCPGVAVLGRVMREPLTGDNAETCGRARARDSPRCASLQRLGHVRIWCVGMLASLLKPSPASRVKVNAHRKPDNEWNEQDKESGSRKVEERDPEN